MSVFSLRPFAGVIAVSLAGLAMTTGLQAEDKPEDKIRFTVTGPDSDALKSDLRAASAVLAARREDRSSAEDLFAAAQGEYGPLLNTLYGLGYYAPVIHVLIDGREAANIPPLDAPAQVGRIEVTVDPGPKFKFSQTRVAPLAPQTELPEDFAPGKTAASGVVREAVQTGVDGWRDVGHAKAEVADQNVVADHRSNTLAADIGLKPGPKLRFGKLIVKGNERMRERRIHKIAGLPEGEVYDPEDLRRSAERLRRSGVFKSVSLTEAEGIRSPDYLDITATLVEDKLRRYSIGAELASFEGLNLTGYWLHRNLLGGGERLKIDGEIANIGAQSSGIDYTLGVTVDRPATLTPDTTLSFSTEFGHLDEEDFNADIMTLGTSFSHYFSEELTAKAGLEYSYAKISDSISEYTYKHIAFPIGVTWDKRDDKLDAHKGFFVNAELRPFLGFGITDSGAQIKADGRTYVTFGEERPVTLAGRAQFGMVTGSDLLATPRDYLFYSGGGGTVRGQPYQSLGVDDVSIYGDKIGGMAFAALSGEVRARVTQTIGLVAFADAGYVGATEFGGANGEWHAGAGLGLRYATGFGPIRFDVATPIKGSVDTGDGVQIYVGIGQAF
ncbi:autotransporter assembly complex protein TamA [Gemmobacter serpentinus]|uniref:autotransporter assembly complex protein TamA n=1 Tax=Gemmobacter serpentinus TaxID=2652247 RepID=UPI001CF636A5|nr:BamA/TamA family outer membrane protein [Gemmobacter serpentinus]